MGGLLALGLYGMWLVRRDSRWWPLALGVLMYWVMLVPFSGEARRTLPLRLPMLLLGGIAVSSLVNKRLSALPAGQ
jgi:hypothetical protein